MPALKAHLQNCPKRVLPREYTIGNYKFTCWMNPRRRVTNALTSMLQMPTITETHFLGALIAFEQAGYIKKTVPEKIKN
jgi:hypothetical protein